MLDAAFVLLKFFLSLTIFIVVMPIMIVITLFRVVMDNLGD